MSGPAWSPDGQTLFFASSRDGRAVRDPRGGCVGRQDSPADQRRRLGAVARTFHRTARRWCSSDTRPLDSIFSRWRLAEAVWEPVTDETPGRGVRATDCRRRSSSPDRRGRRHYNPWRTLAPRFWTPILEVDNDELSAGAATAGVDALGRHAYFGGAAWSTRARPDWYAGYTYDRWRPTFFASISDDTDPWDDRRHVPDDGSERWRGRCASGDPTDRSCCLDRSMVRRRRSTVPSCARRPMESTIARRAHPCGVEHRYVQTIRLLHQR